LQDYFSLRSVPFVSAVLGVVRDSPDDVSKRQRDRETFRERERERERERGEERRGVCVFVCV
jgi:hypothetical protein